MLRGFDVRINVHMSHEMSSCVSLVTKKKYRSVIPAASEHGSRGFSYIAASHP